MPRGRPPGVRDRRPKISDVAARARVSPATVSNYFTGKRNLAPELAARVRAAVEELGYVAHAAASQLRSKRPQVIGVVVHDLPNPYCATFVGTVEELARAQGYRTLVAGSGESPEEELAQVQALAAWQPAGVLIIPTDDRFRSLEVLAANRIPVVAVDRVTAAMKVDSIAIDNAGEGARAAAHLAQLGHRRVLVIASTLKLDNMRERVAGVKAALGPGARVEVLEGGAFVPLIAGAVHERLGRRPLPTALLALTNRATLASTIALHRRGLVVPRDLSLVGFDDHEWMTVMQPGLTAIRQPIEELGRRAWDQLLARLRGDRSPPVSVRLACSLEVRGSCAPPPGGATASADPL